MADPNSNLQTKDGTSTPFTTIQDLQFVDNETKIMGAYIPDTLRLEDMNGIDQIHAIAKFLEQGFNEYYFIMDNFWDLEADALKAKRSDVKFCPVIYFEGLKTDVVASEYGQYIDAVILVSASYYNVSNLETSLYVYDLIFQDKPTRYIVYPTITYNYTRQGYDPPSDRLVMATLSIATRMVDGIIIWHKIDGHLVQDYLHNIDNPNYFHELQMMEEKQIAHEKSQRVCANCVY
jgi:hypothetical protein